MGVGVWSKIYLIYLCTFAYPVWDGEGARGSYTAIYTEVRIEQMSSEIICRL